MFSINYQALGIQNHRNLLAKFGAFVLLMIFFQSCGTNRLQQMAGEGKQFTDNKIEELAKDCDYVRKQLKRGLKRKESVNVKKLRRAERKAWKREQILANDPSWEYKRSKKERTFKNDLKYNIIENLYGEIVFRRNDFLVSLLSVTSCLEGKTKDEIFDLFGKPNNYYDAQFSFSYYVHTEGNQFNSISFIFKENRVECMRVSRSRLSIISCPSY